MLATFDEEEVRERAYRLWEADGRWEGRDEHYWYLAIQLLEEQAQLTGQMSKTIAASPSAREGDVRASKQVAPDPDRSSGLAEVGAGIDSRMQTSATGAAKKATTTKRKAAATTVGPAAGGKKKAAM